MKARNLTSTVKKAGLVFFTMLTFAGYVFAQTTNGDNHRQLTKLDLVNLKAGIQSDNDGVKKDCIYFAAIYDVKEAYETLDEQLKNENNPSLRVLISLALCKLSDPNGVNSVDNDTLLDWREKVSSISNSIINDNMKHITGVASSR